MTNTTKGSHPILKLLLCTYVKKNPNITIRNLTMVFHITFHLSHAKIVRYINELIYDNYLYLDSHKLHTLKSYPNLIESYGKF